MKEYYVRWPKDDGERMNINMLLNALEKMYPGKVSTEDVVLVRCEVESLEMMLEELSGNGNQPVQTAAEPEQVEVLPVDSETMGTNGKGRKVGRPKKAQTVVAALRGEVGSVATCPDCGKTFTKARVNQIRCGECSRKKYPAAYGLRSEEVRMSGQAIGGRKLG